MRPARTAKSPPPMFRLALLDLNNGTPNQGMRCLRSLMDAFADQFTYEEFDVRAKNELPGLGFDIYVSSGGPGSPLASGEAWEDNYFGLLDALVAHNRTTAEAAGRKHVFFICHSFQLAVRYFNAGKVSARRKKSFGTFPVHSSNSGDRDPLFEGLDDPFWVADFREYQVLQANHTALARMGGAVLAFEKLREHVPLERAVMAIRFSREMVGTQFHPEADAEGMIIHFNDPERREAIYEEYGQERYQTMMGDLHDPERIDKTNTIVIPNFLRAAIAQLSGESSQLTDESSQLTVLSSQSHSTARPERPSGNN